MARNVEALDHLIEIQVYLDPKPPPLCIKYQAVVPKRFCQALVQAITESGEIFHQRGPFRSQTAEIKGAIIVGHLEPGVRAMTVPTHRDCSQCAQLQLLFGSTSMAALASGLS